MYPNKQKIDQLINTVNSVNLLEMSDEDVSNLAEDVTSILPIHTLTYEEPFAVERVRANKDGRTFEFVKDLWAPPEEFCSLGRLNPERVSLFYSSHLPLLSAYEVFANHMPRPEDATQIQDDDWRNDIKYYSLLSCFVTEPRKITFGSLYFREKPFTDLDPYQKILCELTQHSIQKREEQFGGEINESMTKLSKCVSELFRANPLHRKDLYRLTSQIATLVLEREEINALIYPSAISLGQGTCLAFSSQSQKFITPHRVEVGSLHWWPDERTFFSTRPLLRSQVKSDLNTRINYSYCGPRPVPTEVQTFCCASNIPCI